MNASEFAYWLQGFSELNAGPPTAEQWASIQDHLALVFEKVTPAIVPAGTLDFRHPTQPAAAEERRRRWGLHHMSRNDVNRKLC